MSATQELIERLRERPNDAPLSTEYMLDEAATLLEQQHRLLEEAREALAFYAEEINGNYIFDSLIGIG